MKQLRNRFVILLTMAMAIAAFIALPAEAATWSVDSSHSSVGFSVKHLAISKTKGTFDDYTATFSFDPGKPESWQAEATIQVASINTDDAKRDDHLRSADFFDVAEHPTMVFKSTGVKMKDEEEGVLYGELTMLGVTKPIKLDLEVSEVIQDPWGNTRVGFTAETKIDRKDWGLTWNKTLDSGGLVVGNDVKITIEIEGIQQ